MSTVSIPLTQGKVALIDAEDAPRISAHKWYALRCRNGAYYAVTKMWGADGKRKVIGMHRVIMDAPSHLDVDHRSRDTLDNRRSNLRLATPSQNKANGLPYRNNHSGFKGVYPQGSGRWQAQVRYHGILHYCGSYDTREEAARAYDARARELFGAFACPNFPD